LAQVGAAHVWLEAGQFMPSAQSKALEQGAPIAPGLLQVEVPEAAGQMSGNAQSWSAPHGAPAPAGAAHFASTVLHTRLPLHCEVAPSQLAPAAPKVTATHVDVPPPPGRHTASGAQGPVQAWPTAAAGTHVPHAAASPLAPTLPAVHSPVWHCSGSAHDAPAVREPVEG